MTDAAAPHALFAYGSLQLDEVVEAVTGRRFTRRAAVLPAHRRRMLAGRSYPGVVRDAREETSGVLLEGLADEDLRLLDLFEGEPYERLRAEVRVGSGERAAAHVYVVRDAHRALLTDERFDLERFRSRDLPGFLEQCRQFRREARSGAGFSESA